MELSSYIEKTWTEKYRIHEVRFVPATGGFFSMPDRFVFVGQKEDEEKNSVFEVLNYDKVSIVYGKKEKPNLTLKLQIVRGQRADAFSIGSYEQKELVEASLKLPTGYKILGIEEKLSQT